MAIFASLLIKIRMKSVMFRKIRANELLMVYTLELSSQVKAHISACFLTAFLD